MYLKHEILMFPATQFILSPYSFLRVFLCFIIPQRLLLLSSPHANVQVIDIIATFLIITLSCSFFSPSDILL